MPFDTDVPEGSTPWCAMFYMFVICEHEGITEPGIVYMWTPFTHEHERYGCQNRDSRHINDPKARPAGMGRIAWEDGLFISVEAWYAVMQKGLWNGEASKNDLKEWTNKNQTSGSRLISQELFLSYQAFSYFIIFNQYFPINQLLPTVFYFIFHHF